MVRIVLALAAKFLKNALRQPFLQIMANAGLNSEALLAQVEAAKPGFGVNVMTPEKGLVDVKKAGVIDPVTRNKRSCAKRCFYCFNRRNHGCAGGGDPRTRSPNGGWRWHARHGDDVGRISQGK